MVILKQAYLFSVSYSKVIYFPFIFNCEKSCLSFQLYLRVLHLRLVALGGFYKIMYLVVVVYFVSQLYWSVLLRLPHCRPISFLVVHKIMFHSWLIRFNEIWYFLKKRNDVLFTHFGCDPGLVSVLCRGNG